MSRLLYSLLAASLTAAAAPAHFVFVVPSQDGKSAEIVLSEELAPDSAVDAAKFGTARLLLRDAAGKDTPVATTAGKHALTAALTGTGPRTVYGTATYGVMQRGEGKPFLIVYYPKAILGTAPSATKPIGEKTPAELVPIVDGGKVRFRFLSGSKPVAGAEVNVLKPDGAWVKVKTGTDGVSEPVEGAGRYGAWARIVEAKGGTHDGKKYVETRYYPTLVCDVPGSTRPPLPVAVSSLGAVACNGYLYVYGGHSGKPHNYSTKTVVGTFYRLKLDGGTKWEELPGGPILQGMNLATHGGKVYRVGGMQPRNAPGEPADNHSLADVARFDPKANKWEALPPLPAPRSSHDVVVVGDKLVVVGGWNLQGKGQKPTWHDTALTLDLSAKEPKWEPIPQPFHRRALTAAAVGSKVYVLGGLGEKGTNSSVDVLDVSTSKWATAPALPGSDRGAFAPAAGCVGGRVVVNTFEGPVYRLNAAGDAWEQVGTAAHKRLVARLIPLGSNAVLLVGGANGAYHVGTLDEVRWAKPNE